MLRTRVENEHGRVGRVTIVALARKLLIALWKYLEGGEVPSGAEVGSWEKKLNNQPAVG